MARQKHYIAHDKYFSHSNTGYSGFKGRPQTAPYLSWHKTIEADDGAIIDATPLPGRTYTRDTWPPRGRGRGESLISTRRIAAKLRALEVVRMRLRDQRSWKDIASALGFADPSGAYRAYKRMMDRLRWDEQRRYELRGGDEYRRLLEEVRAVNEVMGDL